MGDIDDTESIYIYVEWIAEVKEKTGGTEELKELGEIEVEDIEEIEDMGYR